MIVDDMVKKIMKLSSTGLYVSPSNPSFMEDILENHFQTESSPKKSKAFFQFYKMYDKNKKTSPYLKLTKIGGTDSLHQMLCKVKKKKMKPKELKEKNIDLKHLEAIVKKAKQNYKNAMKPSSMKFA